MGVATHRRHGAALSLLQWQGCAGLARKLENSHAEMEKASQRLPALLLGLHQGNLRRIARHFGCVLIGLRNARRCGYCGLPSQRSDHDGTVLENPFVGIRLRRLTLTGDDDLAVRGFEVEVVLTALVVEGFKLCSHAVLSL